MKLRIPNPARKVIQAGSVNLNQLIEKKIGGGYGKVCEVRARDVVQM